MNKKEFIENEINKNIEKFGKWASTERKNSADPLMLIIGGSPKNKLESLHHGNALANTGNYPVGTSECFNVGISGGCGIDCYVFRDGRCKGAREEGNKSVLIKMAKEFIDSGDESDAEVLEMKEIINKYNLEATDGK